MKQNKSVLKIFLSLILSCFFLSEEVFAYEKSDLKKFKNTKKCIKCDLTDVNLSGVNLSGVNLSGSNLSGSNLSGSNLSGSNLSGSNLSGSNLKEVNLTYANLREIIIDEKAFSTLDISEFTFMNKSTLAEETKKKKEEALRKKKDEALRKKKDEALRKKKEEALRKKKEEALRKKKEEVLRKKKEEALRKKKEEALRKKKEEALQKKMEQALRKKKEKELRKKKEQALRKEKEQALRKKAVEGFKDFKFGMTWNQIKATGVCKNWAFIFGGVGTECYKVAGEKRYFYFSFEHWQKNTDGSYAAQNLRRIGVALGKFMPSYYKKLASDLGEKYKEKYRLTIEQSIGLNKGNLITFFEDARVTLVQKDNGINLYYTKAEHPTYKLYSPKDISSDEF